MKRLGTLAFTTAAFAYAVIVVGFIVRITGSGMGCGPEWPKCNGAWIPAFVSHEVIIEWLHRLVVLGLIGLTIALVVTAWMSRGHVGGSGPGGTLRPAVVAIGLLFLQSLLGAVTVWLDLPPASVVLHLGTALALLWVLLLVGLRARVATGGPAPDPRDRGRRGGVLAAAGLAAAVILMGGVTATTGAAAACQGFPLCSGTMWPSAGDSGLPHIHWTHRLLAYALLLHLAGLPFAMRKRGATSRLLRTAWAALGVATAQVVIAAVMVLSLLPPMWRGLHAAVGTALWVVIAYGVWLTGARSAGAATPE